MKKIINILAIILMFSVIISCGNSKSTEPKEKVQREDIKKSKEEKLEEPKVSEKEEKEQLEDAPKAVEEEKVEDVPKVSEEEIVDTKEPEETEEEKIEKARLRIVEVVGIDLSKDKLEYVKDNENEFVEPYRKDYYCFYCKINLDGSYLTSEVLYGVKKGTSDVYTTRPNQEMKLYKRN